MSKFKFNNFLIFVNKFFELFLAKIKNFAVNTYKFPPKKAPILVEACLFSNDSPYGNFPNGNHFTKEALLSDANQTFTRD